MKTDAVILAALPKERQAVLDVLKANGGSLTEYRADGRDYTIAQVGPLKIAVPQPMGMGVTYAALAAADALADLSSKVVVLSGIAGCMADPPATGGSARYLLGDIVVSDLVIDYTLEKDKETVAKDASGGESRVRQLQPRPLPFPSSDALLKAARSRQVPLRGDHPDRYADGPWVDLIRLSPPGGLPQSHRPAVHIGHVLSGNSVMASLEGKRKLLDRVGFNPPPVAIEMEAAGIVRRLVREPRRRRPEFIMVKSLCDWAEGTKDDGWQEYCSHVAALYTLHLLREETGRLFLRDHLDPQEPEAELHARTEAAVNCYAASLGIQSKVLRETAEAVRKLAVGEITDVADGHYKADLGTSEQFLIRAEPFFRNATVVYATSVDTVSTFWTDPGNREDALRYIECQGGKGRTVARLFAFSTPENAHRHGKVLDANLAAYDNVFVCSVDHYRELLKVRSLPTMLTST